MLGVGLLLSFLLAGSVAACPKDKPVMNKSKTASAKAARAREEQCVDRWLAERKLDPYGSPEGAMYAGGTAVFDGTSGGFTGGGSIRYVLARSFFLGVGGHYFKRTGERVFLADATSTPFRLGHPLTIREVPVYGMVGWRFLPDSAFVPYVALGAGKTSYSEKSIVGGIEDPLGQRVSKFSGHFMAGVEWGRGIVRLGAEFMYTTVPDTIGVDGVSKIYGEKDVGGLSVVGKIVLVP